MPGLCWEGEETGPLPGKAEPDLVSGWGCPTLLLSEEWGAGREESNIKAGDTSKLGKSCDSHGTAISQTAWVLGSDLRGRFWFFESEFRFGNRKVPWMPVLGNTGGSQAN